MLGIDYALIASGQIPNVLIAAHWVRSCCY